MYKLKRETIQQNFPIEIQADKNKLLIEVDGKSEQATRSGKNLIPYPIFTSNNDRQLLMPNFKLNAGTYTISFDLESKELGNNSYFSIAMGLFFEDNTSTDITLISIDNSTTLGRKSKTFTTTKNVLLNSSSNIRIGATNYTNGARATLKNIQIEQGSTPTSYEQYGASPSPDFPSEIHSVADDVNLFNKEASVLGSANCTYTYENGVYTITNTNSSNPVLILSNILPKGSYILNSDISLSQATQIRNSNGDTLANCGSNYQNKTFEISSDADRIYFNWATTSNPITLNLNSLKIQKGSVATPYSSYGKGTLTINQRGKNLFDLKTYLEERNVTYTENDDGSITFDGSGNSILFTQPFVFSNSNISISLTGIIEQGTANNARIQILNESNILAGEITSSVNKKENLSGNKLRFNWSTAGTITMKNIQLEKNSQSTDYEPYFNTNYTIQTEPLRSLPNGTKDTIEEETHRNTNEVIFDGSDDEGWELWSGGTNTIGFKISNIANLKNIQSSSTENIVLSNYFKKKTNQDRLTGDDEEGFATAVGNLYFKINRTTVNSLAEWKTWLSTHPTEVLYELAEEVIEPFTEEQLNILSTITTNNGTNIINIIDDISTSGTLKYNPQITDEIKEAVTKNAEKAYIEILDSGTILNESNYLQTVKLNDERYLDKTGVFGTVIAKELTGTFININDDNQFKNIENKEIRYCNGPVLQDESVAYFDYGTFIVQVPENDNVKDGTSFTALDYMVKFNKTFEDRLTYPCTMLKLLEDICDQAGVKLGTRSFRNHNFIVENNQFVGRETCRDVLAQIAQIAFSWARINEDNELVLDFNVIDDVTEELNADDYFELEFNDEYGPINTVILSDSKITGKYVTVKDDDLINAPKGKNLCNIDNVIIGKAWNNADNTDRAVVYTKIEPNTEYTISFNDISNFDGLYYFEKTSPDGERTVGNIELTDTYTRTTNSSSNYIGIQFNKTNISIEDFNNFEIQIEQNQQATDYEPYIPYGEIALEIQDNYFAYTEEKRQQLIQASRELFGFRYIPVKLKTCGHNYLNCLDKIRVKNMQNEYYDTYIFNNTLSFTGATLDEKNTPSLTKSQVEYKYQGEYNEAIKRTELMVDKANGEITGIVEVQKGMEDTISQVKQDINGLSVSITKAGGNNLLYYDTAFWRLSIYDTLYNGIIEKTFNATTESDINSILDTTVSNYQKEDNRISFTYDEHNIVVDRYIDKEKGVDEEKLEINTDPFIEKIKSGNSIVETAELTDPPTYTYDDVRKNTISGLAYYLNNEKVEQLVETKNGKYTLSFLYKTLDTSATTKLIIQNGDSDNETEYELTESISSFQDFKPIEETIINENVDEIKEKLGEASFNEIDESYLNEVLGTTISNYTKTNNEITFSIGETDYTISSELEVTSERKEYKYLTIDVIDEKVKIKFETNQPRSVMIADLMFNVGEEKLDWTQNANETLTDTVTIGKGITISSTVDDTRFKADTDGIRIEKSDGSEEIARFTNIGTETKNLHVENSSNLGGLIIRKIADKKIWISLS